MGEEINTIDVEQIRVHAEKQIESIQRLEYIINNDVEKMFSQAIIILFNLQELMSVWAELDYASRELIPEEVRRCLNSFELGLFTKFVSVEDKTRFGSFHHLANTVKESKESEGNEGKESKED